MINSGGLDMASFIQAGSPVIPAGLKVPVSSFAPGSYGVEVRAADAAGNSSVARTADFEVVE